MPDTSSTSPVPVSQGAAGTGGTTLSEADWQTRVTDTAQRYGWRHCHIRKATVRAGRIATPTSVPGWPDLVLWHETHRVVVYVELKTDKGKLSPAQVDVLESLSAAGALIGIWRPRDWPQVLAFLQDPHGEVAGGAA